jgi:hypothetical protein
MRKLLGTVALVGMLAAPGLVEAQTAVGAAAAYHTEGDGTFGIGAYASIAMPQIYEGLAFTPNFLYFFPEFGDYWELNADATYSFPVADDSPIIPFALAGLNIARSSDTDLALNFGGGVAFPLESIRPVIGGKFETQRGSPFVIFGGVGIPLGG